MLYRQNLGVTMAYLNLRAAPKHPGTFYMYACQDYTTSKAERQSPPPEQPGSSETRPPRRPNRGKRQFYLGKVFNGRCSFYETAKDWSELFRGTQYEEQYWRWRRFMNDQDASATSRATPSGTSGPIQSSPVGKNEGIFSLDQVLSCIDVNAGINLLCSSQCERLHLAPMLTQVFGRELALRILALAFFCASASRTPLYRAANWSLDQKLPGDVRLSENDIAEVLTAINPSLILQFQSLWLRQFPREERLSLDITSISSYARSINDVTWGHNRDNERLPQVNMLLIVSQASRLPAWFEVLPGAINDINTLADTMNTLQQIDDTPRCLVMDRGFASAFNFNELMRLKCKFTCGLPLGRFQGILLEAHELHQNREFLKPENILDDYDFNGYPVSVITKTRTCNGQQIYDHLFYTDYFVSKSHAEILRRVKRLHRDLKVGKAITDPIDETIVCTCFTVTNTPKRGITVHVHPEQIELLRNVTSGFFALRSNQFKDAREALDCYRLRDGVEKRFDDLKNQEDMKRLRVHSSHNMRSRLFIQFLAQILRCDALNHLQQNRSWDSRLKTVSDLYSSMDSLRWIQIEGHPGVYRYPTKLQKVICRAFDIPTDTPEWPRSLRMDDSESDT